ncbi:MAG: copper resistance system multicopper oxidase [Gemmatimonadota bacterium]|nr:copper resistance system multicopper oxidase [Gemmatimonadota bacterium]
MPESSTHLPVSRRAVLQSLGAVGVVAGADRLLPGFATPAADDGVPRALQPRLIDGERVHEVEIAETRVRVDGRAATAVTINGGIPGPLIRLREGEDAIIRVHNRLAADTSIHWHGLLVPPEMDGVPGVSFPGILARSTFEYRYPVRQAGTYWYHSHSGLQEQLGHYGPLILDPAEPLPYTFDREFVLVLSDWTFEDPHRVMDRLKKVPDYYNHQRRTLGDFFRDVAHDGFMPTLRDRLMWSGMRMNPTDIADVTGMTYSYLLNGLAPEANWTGRFQPGERVLIRVINAASSSHFDLRIPGVPMSVVQASGQMVAPVDTDEVRIAPAETYDLLFTLPEDRAYTVVAEAMDRSGFASGTFAPRAGMVGTVPARRRRPVLSMADMGMDHGVMVGMEHAGMEGMDHSAMAMPPVPAAPPPAPSPPPADEHAGHDMPAMAAAAALRPPGTLPEPVAHGPGTHGVGNAMVPDRTVSRLAEPGVGLGEDGWRVLVYTDLRALAPRADFKAPTREIELHLTGNMERYTWGIDGVAFKDAEPIRFTHGERLRLTFVNDTMMNHPMHLHGMWMELENGHGDRIPRIHTVNVKPAERVSLLVTADAPGRWAFHCHLLYHMEVGMFRVVEVGDADPHAGHEMRGASSAG